jgi:hypothetical protein
MPRHTACLYKSFAPLLRGDILQITHAAIRLSVQTQMRSIRYITGINALPHRLLLSVVRASAEDFHSPNRLRFNTVRRQENDLMTLRLACDGLLIAEAPT